MPTCCVYAVRKEHYRLLTLHGVQFLINHHVNCVVEFGAIAWSGFEDSISHATAVVGKVSENPNLVVECEHHHAIVRLQLIYEAHGRILNLFKLESSRLACV